MRISRLLLLSVLAAAVAGVVIPSAGALTFPDEICPVAQGTVIKVCPAGETAKPYSMQIKGREGTGCVPYVRFKSVGALPPGLTLSSDGLISGTPTQPGEWTFWIDMQDIPSWEGGPPWCSDDNSTERQFEIVIVQGIQTSIPLHRLIIADEDFQAGRFDTKFMERFLARRHEHTSERTALGV